MPRSLDAPLSPNEEATLRRVAHGMTKVKHLAPAHVKRLKNLALVEDHDGRLKLTLVGRQRYAALPGVEGLARRDVKDDLARE